ncbi:MAG: hypothetical protein BWZ10_00665 [candidate division BRC1 bacterium ADurb.BinA364]|nr:MAG: hypothetical protein BWZ10_00665 [candidate division BRC1 bacterium ADurb.BinA364]
MKRLTFILAIAGLALSASPLGAAEEPIVISASVDRNEIRIGDQIHVRLSVEWDENQVEFQRIEPRQELGVFEIVDFKQVEDKRIGRARRARVWELTLSTFETGEFEIPPFVAPYKNARGEDAEGRTQPMRVVVKSTLDTAQNADDILPLKAAAEIAPDPKYRRRLYWILGGSAAALALIAAGLAFWARRRRQGEDDGAPKRPIDDLALEALDALEADGLPALGEIKAYYSRLSEILRVYLGRRFGAPAIDMTSSELLEAMRREPEATEILTPLESFCAEADMAKFAKWRASEDRCAASLEAVREMIRLAAPPKPEPPTGPEDESGDRQSEETAEAAGAAKEAGS